MAKSFRYKGKKCQTEGIHSEFMKKIINDRYSIHCKLNLPKPWNQAEISMLSKFLFGVELSVRFEYCYDRISEKIKSPYTSKSEIRSLKLFKLNPDGEDFIKINNDRYDNKMELLYLRYFCDQNHSDYYDSKFNQKVFGSCYEMDSAFWMHCIGELSCGGISDICYGQVRIYSFKETERILNIYNNPNESVREYFRDEIQKLIEADKKYD